MLIKKFVNSTHSGLYSSLLPIHFWAEREEGIPTNFFATRRATELLEKNRLRKCA